MRRGNDSLEAKNIRDMIEYICYKEHKSASKIVTEYNEKYQENYTPQSFSRSLIKNSLKFSMLERILDSAGYRLVLEKKEDKMDLEF